jgi:hypothetical protein
MIERMHDYMIDVLGSTLFEYTPKFFRSIDMYNVSHILPAFHILIDIT